MKLALIGIGLFILAAVGGATLTVVRAPHRPPRPAHAAPAGETTQESRAHPPARGDSSVTRDSTRVVPPPASGTGTREGPTPPRSETVVAAAPPPMLSAPADTQAAALSYGQVARMLTNLKPAQAAQIMQYLSDDQVEGILCSLAVRQAATLLAQLPSERAAALSRRLMARAPGGTK